MGWHLHDCLVDRSVHAPEQNQETHPEGHCPELPESLLTRLFEYADWIKRIPAILAQLATLPAGPIGPAIQIAPHFRHFHTGLGESAQICFSLSRNRALFSIPPPLA
jgi:hypothetical protein